MEIDGNSFDFNADSNILEIEGQNQG